MPLTDAQVNLVRRKLHTRIHALEAFIARLADYEDDLVRQVDAYRLSGLKVREAIDQTFRDVDSAIADVVARGREEDQE